MAGNRLTVVGTDLDLTVRVEVEAIGPRRRLAGAPARLAADIVRSLEPGAVTFEGGDDEVEISAARRVSWCARIQSRTSPCWPAAPDQVTIPAPALAEALRQVVRAASNDDARPLLTGVLVAAESGGTRLVATDSYRLAMRDLSGEGPLAEEPSRSWCRPAP